MNRMIHVLQGMRVGLDHTPHRYTFTRRPACSEGPPGTETERSADQ